MNTQIISNGSKWAGEEPDPIEALFCMLERHPLDRLFDGMLIEVEPKHYQTGKALYAPGTVSFGGNFLTYSHVFHVITDDAALIEDLTAAIRANQQRADYLAQPDHAERKRLQRRQFDRDQAMRDAETTRRLQAELTAISRRSARANL